MRYKYVNAILSSVVRSVSILINQKRLASVSSHFLKEEQRLEKQGVEIVDAKVVPNKTTLVKVKIQFIDLA